LGKKGIRNVTEDELILFLCEEKDVGIEGSNEELIRKFRETYQDQAGLITKATQGDAKALRRLRWICGLRVII
jgi:low affinity Fe/Cu permease